MAGSEPAEHAIYEGGARMSDEVVSPGELPTPGAVGGTGPDQSSGGPHLAFTDLFAEVAARLRFVADRREGVR